MINKNNYMLRLFDILDNRIDLMLSNPYISGMGLGLKTVNNKILDIQTLTFLVNKKLPLSEVHPYYRIPKYINNVITDVIEDGPHILASNETRPASAGLSVSNSMNTKVHGTIAYAVTDLPDKKFLHILSCSHVLNCTLESDKQCTDIIQPAVVFGGVPPRKGTSNYSYIGELTRFTPLVFFNNIKDFTDKMAMEMDAAIAFVGPNNGDTRRNLLAPFIMINEGKVQKLTYIYNTISNIQPGTKIWTLTANSTSRKFCEVLVTNVCKVIKAERKLMVLKNQILVEISRARPGDTFFKPGDSGALGVVDTAENKAFGMLVSIEMVSNESDISKTPLEPRKALFTPIDPIFKRFNVTFAKPTDGITEK